VCAALCRSAESSLSLEAACVAWSGDDDGPTNKRLEPVVARRMSASYERRIVVNVSGLRFETHLSTIERFSRTLLGDAARRDRSVVSDFSLQILRSHYYFVTY